MLTPDCASVPSRVPAPFPAGATRRMATVASAVPEASSTRRSTSRLGTPPVPRMSREARSRPASTQGSAGVHGTGWLSTSESFISPSLHGRDDLDLVAVAQQRGGPGTTRQHVAVERGGDAAGQSGQLGDGLGQGPAVGQLAGLAVQSDLDAHGDRSSPVNRWGVNGAHSGAGGWPARRAVTASAVTGDIRIP